MTQWLNQFSSALESFMKKLLGVVPVLAVLTVVLSSQRAHAEEEIPLSPAAAVSEKPAEKPAETESYGWQIALVDTAAVVVGVPTTIHAKDAAPGLVAGGVWLSAGPLIHVAHGRGRAALASGLFRLSLPTGCMFIGGLLGMGNGFGWGAVIGGGAGMALGVVAATVVDAAFLSNEPKRSSASRTPPPSVRWQPTLGLESRGAQLGVAGAF